MSSFTNPSTSPHPTKASFLYYKPKPNEVIAVNDWDCVLGLDPERHQEVTLGIEDCRGKEGDFKLDREGFCFRKLEVGSIEIGNGEGGEIEMEDEEAYKNLVEGLLRVEFPSASEFLFFPLMIRSEPRPSGKDSTSYFASLATMKPNRHPPISNTHVDWTPSGIAGVYEGNVNAAVGKRIRQSGQRLLGISVWRPLERVQKDPLAVLKATSCDTKVECRIVPRTCKDGTPYENRVVAYSENVRRHEWCWLSDQLPNEVTLIKLADTQPPVGVAECCPHTSLNIGIEGAPHRRSCELRCVVVF